MLRTGLRNGSRIIYCALALGFLSPPAAAIDVITAPREPTTTGAVQTPPPTAQTQPVTVPGFLDPKRRPELPDMSRITQVRFLTEVDYPPFNYAGPDGSHVGFNV